MTKLQTVRGTHDILSNEMLVRKRIIDVASRVSLNYGFLPMQTPMFESTEVFLRPLGESSDVVSKEMYTFEDKGGSSVTLRPEGTAGVVRAFIQNGLQQQLPFKAFYSGAMFRYERPQKGRLRQFHQFGVEILGAREITSDVEVIAMADDILKQLKINNTTLHINTLGDSESRATFANALIKYLTPFKGDLSDASKIRLERNPLRILDSKSQSDIEILKNAPTIYANLNNASRGYFDKVQSMLRKLNIDFILDHSLVRGFDYYCHTTFEFKADDLGSKDTVIGGGRYDGLSSLMGGNNVGAVGFAAGIDRLILMMDTEELSYRRGVVVVNLSEDFSLALKLAQKLRSQNIRCEVADSTNLKKALKFANKINANFAVILGSDELEQNSATIRNLDNGKQELVLQSDCPTYFIKHMKIKE